MAIDVKAWARRARGRLSKTITRAFRMGDNGRRSYLYSREADRESSVRAVVFRMRAIASSSGLAAVSSEIVGPHLGHYDFSKNENADGTLTVMKGYLKKLVGENMRHIGARVRDRAVTKIINLLLPTTDFTNSLHFNNQPRLVEQPVIEIHTAKFLAIHSSNLPEMY